VAPVAPRDELNWILLGVPGELWVTVGFRGVT
jgi:hypothetical protein